MRKYLIGVLALVVAASVVASVQAHTGNQTIDVKTTKTKFPKTTRKGTGLKVDVVTAEEDSDGAGSAGGPDVPAHANKTTLFFSKNIAFNTSLVPKCTANLEGTTTAQAKAACPAASQVSIDGPDSSAQVKIDGDGLDNNSNTVLNAVVTAFNGPANNQITLHARVDAISTTTILIGKLSTITDPNFGSKLDVPVPALAGGAAISDFRTLVKSGRYVSSNCKATTMKYKAVSTYTDHAASTATDSHPCTRG